MKKIFSCEDLERKLFTKAERGRISYMRKCGILLDPDGFDTIDEIRAALAYKPESRTEEIRAALGKAHPSETMGDAA